MGFHCRNWRQPGAALNPIAERDPGGVLRDFRPAHGDPPPGQSNNSVASAAGTPQLGYHFQPYTRCTQPAEFMSRRRSGPSSGIGPGVGSAPQLFLYRNKRELTVANFVVLVDACSERRRRVAARLERDVAPLDGLTTSSAEVGDCWMCWAVSSRAPLSIAVKDHEMAVIWGDAFAEGATHSLTAQQLLADVQTSRSVPAYDGFFAAARYSSDEGLAVLTDVLGMFPVYYEMHEEALLVASSAGLFDHMRAVEGRVDLEAMISTLLMGCTVDGRMLRPGVRRLGSGASLWRDGRGRVEERKLFELPQTSVESPVSPREHAARLHEALRTSIVRYQPGGERLGLMLSGGMDSRLLAGHLADAGGHVHAITFGRPSDYEASCAAAVSRALGFDHEVRDVSEHHFPLGARLQAHHEWLSAGFSTPHTWLLPRVLMEGPARTVVGYLMDVVFTRLPAQNTDPWQNFFTGRNRFGIAASRLGTLLAPEARSCIQERIDEIHALWTASGDNPAQRGWRFHLTRSERASVGLVPWRLSFGSWPIVPLLDQQLLRAITDIPDPLMTERRMEAELVRTRYPAIARLPLDRNTHDTTPLLPSLIHRIAQRVRKPPGPNTAERRRFYRIYSLDCDGWRRIRRVAEPGRDALSDLFCMDAMKEYLPPPDVPVPLGNPILEAHGRKLVLGLMMLRAGCLPH